MFKCPTRGGNKRGSWQEDAETRRAGKKKRKKRNNRRNGHANGEGQRRKGLEGGTYEGYNSAKASTKLVSGSASSDRQDVHVRQRGWSYSFRTMTIQKRSERDDFYERLFAKIKPRPLVQLQARGYFRPIFGLWSPIWIGQTENLFPVAVQSHDLNRYDSACTYKADKYSEGMKITSPER